MISLQAATKWLRPIGSRNGRTFSRMLRAHIQEQSFRTASSLASGAGIVQIKALQFWITGTDQRSCFFFLVDGVYSTLTFGTH